MSKVLAKISKPGSAKMPTTGPHNPNVGTSGKGQVAPRPQASKQGLLASSSASEPTTASMARITDRSSSSGGSFLPVQNNAKANLHNQPSPAQTGAQAPAPRGGPAGLRAGGRNQTYPNGAMYTDASKKGGHGRGGEFQKASTRKTKGAAFFGEYPS